MKASKPTNDTAAPGSKEREGAALAHASALLVFVFPLGNVVGPLTVLLVEGRRSDFVARHASLALLWQTGVSVVAGLISLAGPIHGFDPSIRLVMVCAALVLSMGGALGALTGLWKPGLAPFISSGGGT